MKGVRAFGLKKSKHQFHYKDSPIKLIRYYLIADAFCRSTVVSILKYTAAEEDLMVTVRNTDLEELWHSSETVYTRSKSTSCIKLKNESSKPHMFSISEIMSQSNPFHDNMKT